jgi:hypothetical protein
VIHMGTFIGHILPGAGFLLLGLWHMFNVVGGYVRSPWSYRTRTWFPPEGVSKHFRHAELYFIIIGACGSMAGELLPDRFWSVTTHLNNFEHATISLTLLLYAAFALAIDLLRIHIPQGWLHAAAAIALCQELLLFHFHSADHMGLEGHYHWLLQLPIVVGILALVVEIFVLHLPVIAVLRSMSFVLQGSWFILTGFILWTPSLVPSGCYITDNHVDCPTPNTLMGAKSLANLEFAWLLTGIFFLTMLGFVVASACFQKYSAYHHLEDKHLAKEDQSLVETLDDMEHGGDSSPPSHSQASLELQGIDRLTIRLYDVVACTVLATTLRHAHSVPQMYSTSNYSCKISVFHKVHIDAVPNPCCIHGVSLLVMFYEHGPNSFTPGFHSCNYCIWT